LTEVGVEAGLGSVDEVRTYLTSGKDAVAVDRKAEEARERGISSVPHYQIQGQWDLSGSQEPSAFQKLFMRWKEMEEKGQVGE
jgi:predicted DsbA family dithiol-disulfide isomerase